MTGRLRLYTNTECNLFRNLVTEVTEIPDLQYMYS